jgi:hypothetical protein
VTPSSCSGLSQTFAFAFSNGNGAADITSALIDISSTLSVSGACYIYYVRSLSKLYLASDTGSWQGLLKLGSAATLQNSQCTVHPATTTAVLSGNTLTLNLPLTFNAAFAGTIHGSAERYARQRMVFDVCLDTVNYPSCAISPC